MTKLQTLAYGIRFSGNFVAMMADDLSPEQMLHRPCAGANCCAWILGHLVLSCRGGYKRIGGDAADLPTLPDDDFETRFSRADDAPAATEFGDTRGLLQLYLDTNETLARKVETLGEDVLAEPIDNAPFKTVEQMLAFIPVHTGSHGGHISTIRRSLGMPPKI